jgi:Tol biopolymer transport system component
VTLVKEGGYSYPDWSPTGDKVAFVRDYVAYGGSVTRVMVLDIATGVETWLTPAPTLEGWSYEYGPTFSPDGTTVAFKRGSASGYEVPGLYTVPATGGEPTTVLQTSSVWELDWGPDLGNGHSLIAFRGVPGIQTIEMDETNTFVPGSLHTVCGSSPLLYAPEWSWDGAYLGGNDGSHVLYYLNANGSGVTSLVDGWWFSWKP